MTILQVKQYLDSTILGSKERKQAISLLRKRAHFEHNQDVLQQGKGTLLVERRDGEDSTAGNAEDYWACPECLGFYHRSGIRRHLSSCNPAKSGTKAIKTFYQAMLKQAPSDKFCSVLASMCNDPVTGAVKSDSTILKLGKQLYEKYEYTKEHHVSTKMREVGRVLLKVRETLGKPSLSIREIITEIYFDAVVDATRAICNMIPGQKVKSIPSLALKVGHSMKKLSAIVMNDCIRVRDDSNRKNCKMYQQLHITEWSRRISKYALDALVEKKKLKALPLTADLQVHFNIFENICYKFDEFYFHFKVVFLNIRVNPSTLH